MLVLSIPCFFNFLNSSIFLVGYISNNALFPDPLSSEEEEFHLKEFEKGNIESKNILIERNLRLVAHIAKKYSSASASLDDLISIGTIGLIKGINSYNFSKGVKLSTYISRCIENEILMALRASKKYNQDISLQDPIGTDRDGNEIVMLDIISAENDNIAEQIDLKIQTKQLYKNLKSVLKDREQLVIELRYGLYGGKEVTQQEIAKMLGLVLMFLV